MRQLNEVSIFDERAMIHQNWASLKEFTVWLKHNSFRKIDEGCYSTVYGKPGSNRVLKVCDGGYDRAWLRYANICMHNISNPYLLDVKWVLYFEKIDMFIALMERLQPLDNTFIRKLNIEDTAGLYKIFMDAHTAHTFYNGEAILQNILASSFFNVLSKDNQNKIKQLYKTSNKIEAFIKIYFSVRTSKLYNTYTKLVHFSTSGRDQYGIDLHDENIMYRASDNRPVITDPFVM